MPKPDKMGGVKFNWKQNEKTGKQLERRLIKA
jgi:hypothetical protein